MFGIRHFGLGVAVIVAAMAAPVSAFAAASDAIDDTTPQSAPGAPAPVTADFRFGTEIVVHDWVLCVSESTAERIVKARDEGVAAALATYADLKAAKSCGQFSELHVILHESVYRSDAQIDYDARVYAASVNIGGGWPDGFVIYGALPDNR